jgi:hypothetical protein
MTKMVSEAYIDTHKSYVTAAALIVRRDDCESKVALAFAV